MLHDSANRLVGLVASGHSGYARAGVDIVCAAVSAVTQAVVLGLEEVLGLSPVVRIDEEKGLLDVRLWEDGLAGDKGRGKEREALAVLETAGLALERLAQQYPKYLSVKREMR